MSVTTPASLNQPESVFSITLQSRWILLALFAVGCGSSPTAPTVATIPTVTGQYQGAYRTVSCTESGAAAGSGFCQSITNGGGMVYTPQQSGSNLTGTLGIGGFNIPVSGSVDASNSVTLAGSGPIAFGATMTLTTWRATLSGSQLIGTGTYSITTTDPIGAAVVQTSFTLVK